MIACLFAILAGICNSIMDVTQLHYSTSIFSNFKTKWFAKDSWRNKYKNRDKKQGPLFPGSTTIFVFVTDGWHFFQSLMVTFFILMALFYKPLIHLQWKGLELLVSFIILKILYSLTFELFYSIIWKKRLGR